MRPLSILMDIVFHFQGVITKSIPNFLTEKIRDFFMPNRFDAFQKLSNLDNTVKTAKELKLKTNFAP